MHFVFIHVCSYTVHYAYILRYTYIVQSVMHMLYVSIFHSLFLHMCGNADVSTLYSPVLHRPAVCLPGPEKATVVVKFCPMLFELRDSIGEYIT